MVKIHPLAEVQSVNIGDETTVWQFTVILAGAEIGANCNINAQVFIENDVKIGDNVTIKSGVQIWDGITIENNVFIGPNVTFTNDHIPRSKVYPVEFKKTLMKMGCSIGANSTIVAGVEIGEKALIGAGSVVTKSIPPYTVWYGNPARQHGYITEDSILLGIDLIDKKTNEQYFLKDSQPIKL
ncbi:acyltransferase [Pedobacter nanyangensis]|uniref:acyltransferase n=1 Tax=Pedobacter nanyangensis TaxID=1562389 RepID=UPI000DE5158F|nr:acyltransferase [Pedobacter nanyangensis]